MALHPEHKRNLVEGVKGVVNRIPGMFRPMVLNRKLPELLAVIPSEFSQYTLAELKEALHQAWQDGDIRW